ncbi:DNA polymerase Y family protein [Haloechinothrix sp. LS1_15]|nr:DNA polymerase Y family protein [Haloechinothrix sp. LS1_15]
MLVLWCPDWPVTAAALAAGVPAHRPAAVFTANRVASCSAVARGSGVRRGMLRREAQSRCPELAVLGEDPARDARLFEPVVAAVEDRIPRVDVVRPGVVAAPAQGATAYAARGAPAGEAERALVEQLADQVSTAAGVECQVGIAGGVFAATLAARRGAIVPAGQDAEFLAGLPVTELEQQGVGRAEFVGLLWRLGLRTLGQFAELTERTVASRFGHEGVLAHRFARGIEERPLAVRRPARELGVGATFEPPLERIDTAAFEARALAGKLHASLAAHGLACTRVGIYARTASGEELARVWRSVEPVSAQGVADRVRWQFESWLHGDSRPSSGVVRLWLEPEELVDPTALQPDLWQGDGSGATGDMRATERACRAFTRVQSLLGPEGVCTPVLVGGRGPAERVRFVPWGDSAGENEEPAPWPGRLPAPSPTVVPVTPVAATVLTASGEPVALTARNVLTGQPRYVVTGEGSRKEVLGWAGPWPVDERWWHGQTPGPRGRVQVVTGEGGEGTAFLLQFRFQEEPQWIVEGVYD